MKITLYSFCPNCGSDALKKINQQQQHCQKCKKNHYFNQRPCIGAFIIENNNILLARRNMDPYNGWWDIPGGFMNIDETPQQAIIREVKEEIGLDITVTRLINFYPDVYDYKNVFIPTLNMYFLCTIKDNKEIKLSEEMKDFKWFPLKELPSNIAFKNAREAFKDYFQNKFTQ